MPRKNLRLLAGKPLLAHAIDVARAVPAIARVIVSTEDAEIAAVARQYGAEVPFIRPAQLAKDDSPEWMAWRHAIQALGSTISGGPMDVFVCLPPTAPLRAPEDVKRCMATLWESDADLVITVTPARWNPYFNMVTVDRFGYARVVGDAGREVHRTQEAPPVYDLTTVAYAARPQYVLEAESMFDGKVRAVVVPEERSLDIDTELDLYVAGCLLHRAVSAP